MRAFLIQLKVFLQRVIAKPLSKWLLGGINPTSLIKFIPNRWAENYMIAGHPPVEQTGPDGLPLPPKDIRIYGEPVELHYESGRLDWSKMSEIMQQDGRIDFTGKRILELGCANGRLIRHFKPYATASEIWGTDISARHIYWCRQHLSPPFHFATTTTNPHLPFEDRSMDIVYTGSVFTHIDDLAEAWLLEVHRILSPDGIFYLTVNDLNTIKKMETTPLKNWQNLHRTLMRDSFYRQHKENFGMLVIGRDYLSHVFYDRDYLFPFLESIFTIVSVHEEAFGTMPYDGVRDLGLQTAILLKRRK